MKKNKTARILSALNPTRALTARQLQEKSGEKLGTVTSTLHYAIQQGHAEVYDHTGVYKSARYRVTQSGLRHLSNLPTRKSVGPNTRPVNFKDNVMPDADEEIVSIARDLAMIPRLPVSSLHPVTTALGNHYIIITPDQKQVTVTASDSGFVLAFEDGTAFQLDRTVAKAFAKIVGN